MNCLLVRPRNIYNYNNYPPLGLILLGSVLEANGHRVTILNCAWDHDRLTEEAAGADMVGVGFLTSEVPDAYEILSQLRTHPCVVAGGMHPTLFPQQVSDLASHVVVGEGESAILSIVDGTERKPVEMESLPLPNYSLEHRIETFITGQLTDPLSTRVHQPMRWLPYESSRGCPHRCAFCINTVVGNTRYRSKSADKVVYELASIAERYHLTHVKIIDDDFFVNIERVRAICEGMEEIGLNVTWDAECRADYFDDRRLDDETLRLLVRSGLVQLTLGLESGSSHSLRLMNKGFEPEQGEKAVRKCDEFGILARSSFILEVPGETIEDIRQTITFVNRLRKYPSFVCGATTFRPYPRCKLTEGLIASGQLKEPQTFEEWAKGDAIRLYTAAEYARPWQIAPRYSESAAHFLTLESSTRLGDHQLTSRADRLINSGFRALAQHRNRTGFYGIALDKWLYRKFVGRFYRRRA